MTDERARQYFAALQTHAFLSVPLLAQGNLVGYLGLDNAVTGRPIPETIQDLLFTIGAQIAGAIDRARVYQTLERRVEERTAELAAATHRAEDAAVAIAQADGEKGALLAEMRAVLDAIDYGILLFGPDLRVRLGNRAICEMWRLPETLLDGGPTLADLINFNRDTGLYDVPKDQWEAYVAQRVEAIRQGAIPPTQFRRRDGRILRYQALVLPDGGRMLTYLRHHRPGAPKRVSGRPPRDHGGADQPVGRERSAADPDHPGRATVERTPWVHLSAGTGANRNGM